jgi:hypothetical protein
MIVRLKKIGLFLTELFGSLSDRLNGMPHRRAMHMFGTRCLNP